MNGNLVFGTLIKQEKGIDVTKNIERRQVLVNFGLGRKKVFPLDGHVSLAVQFTNYVKDDPAFEKVFSRSYLVFQEYSAKFGTWVDIDSENKLSDGAVVNAMFFPRNIETDLKNPSFIKHKRSRKESETEYSVKRSKVRSATVEDLPLQSSANTSCSPSVNTSCQCFPVGAVPASAGENVCHRKSINNFLPVEQCNKIIMSSKKRLTKKQHKLKRIVTNLQNHESNRIHSLPSMNMKTNPASLEQNENVANLLNIDSAPSVTRDFHNNQQVIQLPRKNDVTPGECDMTDLGRKQTISEKREDVVDITKEQNLLNTSLVSGSALVNSFTQEISSHLNANTINLKERHVVIEIGTSHKHDRLNWARDFIHWTPHQWGKVIFSDAIPFAIKKHRIHMLARGKVVDNMTVFWSYLSINGPQVIVPFRTYLNSRSFGEMLTQTVIPSFPECAVLFCHSHFTTLHESKKAENILTSNSISWMVWPKCCLDVNPLHYLWDVIFKRLKKVRWTKVDEMISVILDLWREDDELKRIRHKLISSMPETITKMIESKGGVVDMVI